MPRRPNPPKKWVDYYFKYRDAESLPGNVACLTFDGKEYSREYLIDLIGAGSDAWNEWRLQLPRIMWHSSPGEHWWVAGFLCKLPKLDLRRKKLRGFIFTGCDFYGSRFTQSEIEYCYFHRMPEGHSFEKNSALIGSVFRSSEITIADFSWCNVSGSDFQNCLLNGGSISNANFSNCNFHNAVLMADFESVDFTSANFDRAHLFGSLIDLDLSQVQNLSTIVFQRHIVVDHRTLVKSGVLPDIFYRGCGFPENFVDYLPGLVQKGIVMSSIFVSHSSFDKLFVEKLYRDLQQQRIRCFYAPRDLKIGSIIRDSIDNQIHVNDKLLLVLSKNSIGSQWVEHEVEAALEIERKENRNVLFPIMVDRDAFQSTKGWVSNLRRQRHIGDFVNWKNAEQYHQALTKLLSDLTS